MTYHDQLIPPTQQRVRGLAVSLAITCVVAVAVGLALAVLPPMSIGVQVVLLILGLLVVPAISWLVISSEFLGDYEPRAIDWLLPYHTYVRCGLSSHFGNEATDWWIHPYALVIAPLLQVGAWFAVADILHGQGIELPIALAVLLALGTLSVGAALAANELGSRVSASEWRAAQEIDPTHEWQRVDTRKRVGPATRAEVYNALQGDYATKVSFEVAVVWITLMAASVSAALLLYRAFASHAASTFGWLLFAAVAFVEVAVVARTVHNTSSGD